MQLTKRKACNCGHPDCTEIQLEVDLIINHLNKRDLKDDLIVTVLCYLVADAIRDITQTNQNQRIKASTTALEVIEAIMTTDYQKDFNKSATANIIDEIIKTLSTQDTRH